MSDSENEEIPALDVPEVEEEAPAAVEPPPKKACLTAEERKAMKKNANAKYYENVRQKLQEAEEKKEEKAEKKPKAKKRQGGSRVPRWSSGGEPHPNASLGSDLPRQCRLELCCGTHT